MSDWVLTNLDNLNAKKHAYLVRGACELTPLPVPTFRPRTLMGIPPKDLSVTDGDHLLLHVRQSKEQLCHGSSVAVLGDPPDSNPFTYY